MKKILILGSNSFSGNHLINYLLQKNFLLLDVHYPNNLRQNLIVLIYCQKKKSKTLNLNELI